MTSLMMLMAKYNGTLPGDHISNLVIRDCSFWILIVGMFGVGLNTNPCRMLKYVKRPIGPLIGVFCQFVIMPCVTIASMKIANFTSQYPQIVTEFLSILFEVLRYLQ